MIPRGSWYRMLGAPGLGSRREAGLLLALLWAAGLAILTGHGPEPYELRTLFRLRGPRPAPEQVAIVAIDRQSIRELNLAPEPEDWSRAVHARLVEALHAAGAGVIVFDIFFRLAKDPLGDQRLAEALANAGNVLLCDYLRRDQLPWEAGPQGSAGLVNIDTTIPPLALLGSAARASAPFPLAPPSSLVQHGWVFKTGIGKQPTLPAVALHMHAEAALTELLALVRLHPGGAAWEQAFAETRRERNPCGQLSWLRELFALHPRLAAAIGQQPALRQLPAASQNAVRRLLELYTGPAERILNFYGPARAIATIPLQRVLADPAPAGSLQGKTIFVGVSDPFQTEHKDYYRTPFSPSHIPDVGGVEIAATIYANLLEGSAIQRLPRGAQAALLGCWAALLSLCAWRLSLRLALAAYAGLGLAYLGGAALLFGLRGLWLPLAAPLLAALPLALGASLAGYVRQVRRERRQIREAVGLYLPAQAVAALSESEGEIGERWQSVQGVCMATDAAQYSRLAERMDPTELSRLMNRYYEALFRPVRAGGGIVSDIVGDAMMALWACPPAPRVDRRAACLAALEVLRSVEAFNQANRTVTLPTRIGLHAGEFVLGNLGAVDHYEYRAVGDVVNSAARLEGLNKSFGTRIIASREAIEGLDDLLCRPLGEVQLAGKTRPLTVFEPICRRGEASPEQVLLCAHFQKALEAYRHEQWSLAAGRLRQCLELRPDDGPSLHYLEAIARQRG